MPESSQNDIFWTEIRDNMVICWQIAIFHSLLVFSQWRRLGYAAVISMELPRKFIKIQKVKWILPQFSPSFSFLPFNFYLLSPSLNRFLLPLNHVFTKPRKCPPFPAKKSDIFMRINLRHQYYSILHHSISFWLHAIRHKLYICAKFFFKVEHYLYLVLPSFNPYGSHAAKGLWSRFLTSGVDFFNFESQTYHLFNTRRSSSPFA